MNVRTVCLAILNFGDTTGYDIRKLSSEGAFSYFVDASYGSIYPALKKLEQNGLVTKRLEAQEGKPNRKMYSITDQGRQVLLKELLVAPQHDIFRSEFLLIGMCAEDLPQETLKKAIQTRKEQLSAEINHLKEMHDKSNHKGTQWIARYGIHCLTNSLHYIEHNSDTLIALGQECCETSLFSSPSSLSS